MSSETPKTRSPSIRKTKKDAKKSSRPRSAIPPNVHARARAPASRSKTASRPNRLGRPMGIFKAYDIRGKVPSELNPEIARKIGTAFAKLLSARRIVVGQDMRTHSPAIAEAVIEGIRDTGCDVTSIGLASTPMAYFAIGSNYCAGGLNVTASHNPGEYNGMKLCGRGARPISAANGILDIERM